MCTDAPDDICPDDAPLTVLYTGTRSPTIKHPGLAIVHRPMLKPAPLDFDRQRARALAKQSKTLVFYSPNAVDHLADSGVLDGLALHEKTAWAVGEKTAESLHERFGVHARVPEDPQFTGMLAHFHARKPELPLVAFGIQGSPRSLMGDAPGQFAPDDAAQIHQIPIYQTTAEHHADLGETIARGSIRWVALTSPRGVDAFVSHFSASTLAGFKLATIGPTTADALRGHGLTVDLMVQLPDRNAMMLEILHAASLAQPPSTQPP